MVAEQKKNGGKKGALEVDTLAGFVVIVILLIVVIGIILKNKDFIQRLLP